MDFSVNYDVAVIGGGVAGVAAALQSARMGRKTVLIEKTILLGGLATSGLVYIYLPLCDGMGHQVTYGISQELLHLALKYGPGEVPENWRNGQNAPESSRYICRFSPASFMLSLEEILLQEKVDIWYDTLVCGAEKTDGRVTSVIVENESGRGMVSARQFIDASGTGIVLRRAGIPCLTADNSLTMWDLCCRRGGGEETFGPDLQIEPLTTFWPDGEKGNAFMLPENMISRFLDGKSGEEAFAALNYRGLTGKSTSAFVQESHRLLRLSLQMQYEAGRNRHDHYPVKLPLMPQFRKLYCVKGEYVLKSGENGRYFEDSIGMAADWRRPGSELVYEIPYRTLYPADHTGGILAAGRCTSAQGDAWEITRVIPAAAMTGQVAAAAASMCIDRNVDAHELPVNELQALLRDLGFSLHTGEKQ